MKKFLCSVYLNIKHLLISFSQFNQIHVMDRIIYKGKKCFVNNGIAMRDDGEILWDILPEEWDENGKRSGWSVTRTEFRRVFCWFNIKNALFSYYKWWKDYWYKIYLRQMLDR